MSLRPVLGPLRAVARRAALLPLLPFLPLVGSCDADLDGESPVVLSAFDPELLVEAGTFVFSFSKTRTCADIVDRAPDEIAELLAAEDAPVQALDPSVGEHVFGKVTPDVPIAYFVLASTTSEIGERVELAALKGTVLAVGCRDLSVKSGTRQDLPITLFPVGLR